MDNTMLISAMTMLLIVTMGGFTWQIIRAIGEATKIMTELLNTLTAHSGMSMQKSGWETEKMKTLDEVIKALEICKNPDINRNCKDCPMPDTQECMEVLMTDALHYLRELRDMTDIPMEYFESGGK